MDVNNEEPDCNQIALSEEYIQFVIENGERLIEEFDIQPSCIHHLNEMFSIVYLKLAEISKEVVLKYIEFGLINAPLLLGPYAKTSLDSSQILYFHNQPYLPLSGRGVLIGIIDSGIDYTHNTFIYEDNTTKILRLWDQTIQENPPDDFYYGTEYTNEDINRALESEDPYEIVPTKDELGHGTFLAGIAAGREDRSQNFVGAAPDAELIVVKLKPAKEVTKNFSAVYSDTPVYETADFVKGLQYVDEQAQKLGRPISIVVGLGSNEGSHNGLALVEMYMGQIAGRVGRVLTVASGNEGNLGHHYRGEFSRDEDTAQFEISVASGEKGFVLFIWGNSPDKFSLTISSPTGEVTPLFVPREQKIEEIELILEKTKVSISYYMSVGETVDQLITVRFEEPTEGLWTFTLYGMIIVNGRFDAWLPREGWSQPGTVFLRADPYTTATVPSTTLSVITTGAYHDLTDSLYRDSGRGYTRDDEIRPDLAAPGVNIWGPLPGNRYGLKTGTSIAAAITGGASALLLEWGIVLGNDRTMDTRKAKAYLIRGAERKMGMVYPNPEWGFGTLNLKGTFESMRL